MNKAIGKGWGFWDVTHYPYGGNFDRAQDNLAIVENLGPAGRYPKLESKVRLADNRLAVVKNEAIIEL